jgi:hypothetical protein
MSSWRDMRYSRRWEYGCNNGLYGVWSYVITIVRRMKRRLKKEDFCNTTFPHMTKKSRDVRQ